VTAARQTRAAIGVHREWGIDSRDVDVAERAARSAPLRDGGEPGVAASRVHALPAFDEYYLSYADRSRVCPPDRLPEVGPTRNGLVRPVLVAEGRVVGTWTHSLAVGRHTEPPVAALWPGAGAAVATEAAAALDAYAAFVSG
jgi:hypothetical protein